MELFKRIKIYFFQKIKFRQISSKNLFENFLKKY